MLSLYDYGFAKRGRESVGGARQWNPAAGRNENCQVGVFLLAGGTLRRDTDEISRIEAALGERHAATWSGIAPHTPRAASES